jgi:signal transduction histidine kinase
MRTATRRAFGGLLILVVASVIIPLTVVGSAGAAEQKKVLVIYSTRKDTQIAIAGDRELPRLLERGLDMKPDFYSEYIDGARFPEPQYEAAFHQYLTLKYAGSRFDLIIATTGIAEQFVASHRHDLFGDTPVVYTTRDRSADRMPNAAAVVIDQDFRPAISLALSLQPDTTQVFVVVGSSSDDHSLEERAQTQFASFPPSLTFTYLSNLTTDELERRVAALPEHSILFYLLFYQGAEGANLNPLDYLSRIAAIANRPMYSWVDSTMSRGIIGGSLISIDAEMEAIAAVAVRVLRGEPADAVATSTPNLYVDEVDWRQLQRWRISEARVPPGTRILFREPTVWGRYKIYIAGAVLLLAAQTALIAGLIVQSGRRRAAEERTRRSEADRRSAYTRVRDLGARLITAQEEERARISRELHDDIIQQVALLGINLEVLLAGGYEGQNDDVSLEREALDRVRQIAASIRALSHQLHPAKLRLTGLLPALASLQTELSRPGLTITFTHENVPGTLPHDLTLCLFRIVQEALQNAVKHSGARQASVHLAGTSDGLALTVADNGRGFDVDAAWGKGLGLISMVERLEPFGGTLNIRARPGSGTRLDVNVPLTAAEAKGTVAV